MRNKIIARLRKRARNEQGASTTIEFLFVIILLFMFTMTVIDLGLYFNNRMIVTNAAENGSRLVSIYGGNSKNSDIAKGYADKTKCSNPDKTTNQSPVECAVANELAGKESAAVNLQVDKITCGPNTTGSLGVRTYCTINWKFGGVPGSALSFVRGMGNDSGVYTTTETSNSEVINNK